MTPCSIVDFEHVIADWVNCKLCQANDSRKKMAWQQNAVKKYGIETFHSKSAEFISGFNKIEDRKRESNLKHLWDWQ